MSGRRCRDPPTAQPSMFYPFYERAQAVQGSKGLTTGFPKQFHYTETKRHSTYSTPEYVNIFINDQVGIPQVDGGTRKAIIGDYQSMVPDFPFDPIHDDRVHSRLLSLGFGAIGLAAFLMS